MAGIEQTKEVMTFIFSLSEAVEKSLDDGEFSWSDARYFLDPLKKLKPALNEIDEVIPEIMDLDDDELSELVAYTNPSISITDCLWSIFWEKPTERNRSDIIRKFFIY